MGRLDTTRVAPDRFRQILGQLNGLRFAPAKLDTHWLGLKDIPASDLEAVVSRAAIECDEFPSPKMLRAWVRARREQAQPRIERDHPVAPRTIIPPVGGPLVIAREWKYYCDDCRDGGWLDHWCGPEQPPHPWVARRACDRTYAHGAHEWVRLCPCVERNPDVPMAVKQRSRMQGGE